MGCTTESAEPRRGFERDPSIEPRQPAARHRSRRDGEWLDSLDAVVDAQGKTRARYLLSPSCTSGPASCRSARPPRSRRRTSTPSRPSEQPWFPGDEYLERRIRAYIRWNAAVMVVKANKQADGIGGHLSTFASSAIALRGRLQPLLPGQGRRPPGDHVYFQGHAAPGIYARAFLEGRLDADPPRQLPPRGRRRRPVVSYPHPWLMPDFWEYPTVSMGLGPINSIYQARFNHYLQQPAHRRHQREPGVVLPRRRRDRRARDARLDLARRRASSSTTSSGSSTATCSASTARCAATARSSRSSRRCSAAPAGTSSRSSGAAGWDELLARDVDGVLLDKMNTTVDGEFQRYAVESGAYIREHFFGPDPRLRKLVEHLSDDELRRPAPRRPRLPEALRRLQGRDRDRGRAHRHPGQDGQGLDARLGASRAATPPTRSRR